MVGKGAAIQAEFKVNVNHRRPLEPNFVSKIMRA